MASSFTQPHSPFVWLRVKVSGVWVKRKTNIRVDDPQVEVKTETALAEARLDEAKTAESTSGKPMDLRNWNWVPLYLERHYAHSEKSLKRARACWATVSVFLRSRKITEPALVEAALGHDYVAWRQNPPPGTVKARKKNTALTEFKIWGGIMQHAVVLGLKKYNPLYRLGIRKAKAKVKPEITVEEEAIIRGKLAAEAPQWMADAFQVAMKQGCRLRQCQVPMEDIDLSTLTVRLPPQKGKEHTMPLHPDLVEMVMRRREERGKYLVEFPKSTSRNLNKFWQKKVNMPHLSFHCTRVTVITRLLRAGWTPAQVMQYIGHSSEEVNIVYRRLKAADVAKLTSSL